MTVSPRCNKVFYGEVVITVHFECTVPSSILGRRIFYTRLATSQDVSLELESRYRYTVCEECC